MSVSIETLLLAKKLAGGGGSGGTGNYNQLTNLPSVNGVELRGNKTAEQLGLMSEESAEDLENAKQVTYAELKALRDNSQLVPGMLYRITDYVTTINGTVDLREVDAYKDYIGEETLPEAWFHYARSAGHPFDLVVTAISENELDERASALHHEGDTYFANSNLGAWQLKYTIDNDRTKYTFADPVNGKGIITWMRDEFNNECFYDFKNVQYLCYALEMENTSAPLKDYLCYDPTNNRAMRYGNSYSVFWAILDWMYDGGEEDFVSPYKKHKLVAQDIITTCIDYPTVDATYLETFNADWYYTFSIIFPDSIKDYSLGIVRSPYTQYNSWGSCNNNYISNIDQDIVVWWDSYIDSNNLLYGLNACILYESVGTSTNPKHLSGICHNRLSGDSISSILGDGAIYNEFIERIDSVSIADSNCVHNNRISYMEFSVASWTFRNNIINKISMCSMNSFYYNYFPSAEFSKCDFNSFSYNNGSAANLSIRNVDACTNVNSIYDCTFNYDFLNINIIKSGRYQVSMTYVTFDACSYIDFELESDSRKNTRNYRIIGDVRGANDDNRLTVPLALDRNYVTCLGMDSNGQLKEWIPAEGLSASDVPSKTSDLTNDSGFLTLATLPIWDGGVSG